MVWKDFFHNRVGIRETWFTQVDFSRRTHVFSALNMGDQVSNWLFMSTCAWEKTAKREKWTLVKCKMEKKKNRFQPFKTSLCNCRFHPKGTIKLLSSMELMLWCHVIELISTIVNAFSSRKPCEIMKGNTKVLTTMNGHEFSRSKNYSYNQVSCSVQQWTPDQSKSSLLLLCFCRPLIVPLLWLEPTVGSTIPKNNEIPVPSLRSAPPPIRSDPATRESVRDPMVQSKMAEHQQNMF